MAKIKNIARKNLRKWNQGRSSGSQLRNFLFVDVWAVRLFTENTSFGRSLCFLDSKKRGIKIVCLTFESNEDLPVCSVFQTDVRDGFLGCKWFYLKDALENALKILHEVRKMGIVLTIAR